MTRAAIKRAERRAENAELKAKGICIECFAEHGTGTMRCGPCGDRNRGGPLVERDPVVRLNAILAVDTASLPRSERRRITFRRHYWRKRVAKMGCK